MLVVPRSTVTLSTREAEYVAMAQGGKTALFIKSMLDFCRQSLPVILLIGLKNQEAIAMAENQSTGSGRSTLTYVMTLSGSW